MEVSALLNLIAEGKVINTKHLPMEVYQFLIKDCCLLKHQEITHALLGKAIYGKDVVVAFIMYGELYQSDLPQSQPELTLH